MPSFHKPLLWPDGFDEDKKFHGKSLFMGRFYSKFFTSKQLALPQIIKRDTNPMSDPKALEIAAQTVYYDESGKKISRQEHIARFLKEKKVKVLDVSFAFITS